MDARLPHAIDRHQRLLQFPLQSAHQIHRLQELGHGELTLVEDLVAHAATVREPLAGQRQAHVVDLVVGHGDHRPVRGEPVRDTGCGQTRCDQRRILVVEARVEDRRIPLLATAA
jgi:hypothetical protein